MRVIECNECGETISAADDDDLRSRLARHLEDEHELEVDEAEMRDLVEEQAYDATDS